MKAYEACFSPQLPRRMPLIVRVDGRAFHSLTASMDRPFDLKFVAAMGECARTLACSMQGFQFGYVQSDEASFFLQDYAELNTQPWFGKDLSKIVSISAATMSVHFSHHIGRLAVFDSRCFVMPEADVPNYFLWRAKDWNRNSLQMYARAHFSHKQLHNKGREDMHNMLHEIGRNWTTDLPDDLKNGTFLVRNEGCVQFRHDVLPTYESIFAAMSVSDTEFRTVSDTDVARETSA
jgi:tRNA(His) guanylyltransferase